MNDEIHSSLFEPNQYLRSIDTFRALNIPIVESGCIFQIRGTVAIKITANMLHNIELYDQHLVNAVSSVTILLVSKHTCVDTESDPLLCSECYSVLILVLKPCGNLIHAKRLACNHL